MALVKSVMLVDGENLVFSYQEMLEKTKLGLINKPSNIHIKDAFIWNNSITGLFEVDIFRIKYFTSYTGDEVKIAGLKEKIANIKYEQDGNYYRGCQLQPYIYKKPKQTQKSSLVDMNVAVEAMRMAYSDSVDVVWIISEDGDFIELYRDLMGRGKQVCVAALSSGLNPNVKSSVDRFFLLDEYLFDKKVVDIK